MTSPHLLSRSSMPYLPVKEEGEELPDRIPNSGPPKSFEEEFKEGMEERLAIPAEIRKALRWTHANLDHCSNATLCRYMRAGTAKPEAIMYATYWTCKLCSKRAKLKPFPQVTLWHRPKTFNRCSAALQQSAGCIDPHRARELFDHSRQKARQGHAGVPRVVLPHLLFCSIRCSADLVAPRMRSILRSAALVGPQALLLCSPDCAAGLDFHIQKLGSASHSFH